MSIFKNRGSEENPANYRPISLLTTFYKIYCRLIQNRLAEHIDDRTRNTQYGFRKEKHTGLPLHVFFRAQELFERTRTPFYAIFLDWQMAFDRIDHTALIQSLRRLGLPKSYLDAISSLYDGPTFIEQKTELRQQLQAAARQESDKDAPSAPTYLF